MAIGALVRLASKALAKKTAKESTEVAKKGTELIGRRPARDMGMVEDVTPKRLGAASAQEAEKRGKGAALAAGAAGAAGAALAGYAATRGKDEEVSNRVESKGRSFQEERPRRDAARAMSDEAMAAKAPSTFGSAFKQARASGDKTFMYEGKKYTTELAEEKKAAKPSETTGVREGRNENIDEETRNRAMASVANLNKGGMMKVYAKGGMVKANCGASVAPAQKGKK